MLAGGADPALAAVLTHNSHAAVQWLRSRAKVSLEQMGQLGGHSYARTHRPGDGLTGSKLVFALKKQLTGQFSAEQFTLHYNARVTALVQGPGGAVQGVRWSSPKVQQGAEQQQLASSVIIAAGGYASDQHGAGSLLAEYRPELLKLATTNGRWAVGDGVRLGRSIGAKLVDMAAVQVHPTAFIDPANPTAETKTLCAEILRGAGAVLLDSTGARFVDELQKRDVVTAHMVRRGTELAGGREPKQPAFHLVLGAAAAEVAHKHVTMYSRKGLLHRHESISELAEALKVPVSVLQHTLHGYDQQAASGGADQFGKQHFHNTPVSQGPFYTGTVSYTHLTLPTKRIV
eukprot:TRINITY_DN6883_c0_g1_i8.p1 TRINITY_DN6883_c0_g1~~TRINITY_DN6883_c0_g1_i8.p1  ORF type:complete len:345 (-),score=122.78 TRINITY_DN6883_c0_g1_i8:46-1080(-)